MKIKPKKDRSSNFQYKLKKNHPKFQASTNVCIQSLRRQLIDLIMHLSILETSYYYIAQHLTVIAEFHIISVK